MVAFIYYLFQDNLPPRTPHKVARIISGLKIPNSSILLEFEDQWIEFNGNGHTYIALQLDDEIFLRIYHEAQAEGYKNLPIVEEIDGPLSEVSAATLNGLYMVQFEKANQYSYNAVVLSSHKKQMHIYVLDH